MSEPAAAPPSPRPRRRTRRRRLSLGREAQQAFVASLARHAVPGVDFFLQTALAALVWDLALLADSPLGVVLGALLAPVPTPLAGLSVGTVTLAWGYFGRVLGALLVGWALSFLLGMVGGMASPAFAPLSLARASPLLRLSPASVALAALGGAWLTWTLAKRPERAGLPGVALSLTVSLPMTAAGFGLAGGIPALRFPVLTALVIHLGTAWLASIAALIALGFRSVRAWMAGGLVALLLALLSAGLTLASRPAAPPPLNPTTPPGPAPTTSTPPTPPLRSPISPSPTPTPAATATPTPTASPTPIVAYIHAAKANGANLRAAPGFAQPKVGGALNGTQVIVLATGYPADGVQWAKVYVPSQDLTGWVVQSLLVIATPAPRW